ncbi:MAG: hypothetical protein HQ509_06600 [Candidatus Marinimicrobia bacterium]|nr:hypothetical protein [Candidatus Neomarinimicrobiota bacterium]
MWKEIISAWKSDNLLAQAWDQSYEMLDISREMFNESVRVLRTTDNADVNIDIREKDKIINKYEQDVRRKVMTHCSIGGTGLVGGMVLTSIVIDIERLGDYCKNILELVTYHSAKLSVDEVNDALDDVEKHIKYQFDNIIDALKTNDEKKARKLMKSYKKGVRRTTDSIVKRLIEGDINATNSQSATALALYARYLKRISAHLSNILSSVVNPFERIGFRETE